MLGWFGKRWTCWRQGHDPVADGETLGGVWIRCRRCGSVEEYLPGVHEPWGYDYP